MPRCCVDGKASTHGEEGRYLLRAEQLAPFHVHPALGGGKDIPKGRTLEGQAVGLLRGSLRWKAEPMWGRHPERGSLGKVTNSSGNMQVPAPRSQQTDVPENVGQDRLVKQATLTAPLDRVETKAQGQEGSYPGSQAEWGGAGGGGWLSWLQNGAALSPAQRHAMGSSYAGSGKTKWPQLTESQAYER